MPLLKHDFRLTDWFVLDSKDGGFFFLVFIVKAIKFINRGGGGISKENFSSEISCSRALLGVQVKGLGSGSRVHAGRCWKARAALGCVPRQTLLVPSPHHPSGQDLKTSVVLRPGRPFEPRLPTMGCTCPWGPRVRMLWQGPNTILTCPLPPIPCRLFSLSFSSRIRTHTFHCFLHN